MAEMPKVLFGLPEGLLTQLDKVAATETRTRSETIREAIRTYIKLANRRLSIIGNAQLEEEYEI